MSVVQPLTVLCVALLVSPTASWGCLRAPTGLASIDHVR